MFSIAQLLLPISAAQTCGEDLSFSSELDDIAKARTYDDPTLDQGEWVVALKEADWGFVGSRCARLIESKSKDLRLAVWLAEAHAKTRGLRGLGDGFAVLAGLCEHYWDGLYPLADDGQFEQRVGNLGWLLGRTPQLVREMAVTEEMGYTWADFDAARQRAAGSGGTDNQAWGSAPDAALALADLDAQRRRNSADYNEVLLADAQYCLAMLADLEKAVDARLGVDGPAFAAAREALQGLIHFVAPLAGGAASAASGEAAGDVDGARCDGMSQATAYGPLQAGEALRNRTQALAQLRLVADFFRRTEPHSPVAYLAEKAASWGEQPLHLWLRAVVKDPATLASLEDLLGATPSTAGV
ncbi:type VI secretion system protein TssA [Duganella sp. LX20W]|uniref:Type VI secretion system protein TssA n=1 Tax=Rugamonas brunnea TaxID=2758569 RepID=A0A7W2EVP4_9BURK|nr:type VI secretion system protein TssA [Rugamonas brunnea]MBA5639487.1 type VI secretion system protein TssA [Rugamonas brunnea]